MQLVRETTTSSEIALWVGYLLESDIASRTGNTITFNNGDTSFDRTKVQVMAFTGIDQNNPIASTGIDQSDVNANTGSSALTTNLTWSRYDMPIYATGIRNTGTHSTPTGFTRQFYDRATTSGMSSGYKTDVVTPAGGSEDFAVTYGTNGQNVLIGAILQADGNAP